MLLSASPVFADLPLFFRVVLLYVGWSTIHELYVMVHIGTHMYEAMVAMVKIRSVSGKHSCVRRWRTIQMATAS